MSNNERDIVGWRLMELKEHHIKNMYSFLAVVRALNHIESAETALVSATGLGLEAIEYLDETNTPECLTAMRASIEKAAQLLRDVDNEAANNALEELVSVACALDDRGQYILNHAKSALTGAWSFLTQEYGPGSGNGIYRTSDEILEAQGVVSGLVNESEVQAKGGYAVHLIDAFRWLRGEEDTELGRIVAEHRAA
jgi:hypothetical protein